MPPKIGGGVSPNGCAPEFSGAVFLQISYAPEYRGRSFAKHLCPPNFRGKVFRIGTVRYSWSISAHASQAFSKNCTDSEDLPFRGPFFYK